MAVLRRIARPLLAGVFISGGYDAVRDPARLVPAAEPVPDPVPSSVAPRASLLPESPEDLIRLNGAVQLGAGALLAVGRVPRPAALALAATLVPATLGAHRFWEVDDKEERAAQRDRFLANVALFGALLLAAADTHGKPSLAYRARRTTRHAAGTVSAGAAEAVESVRHHLP